MPVVFVTVSAIESSLSAGQQLRRAALKLSVKVKVKVKVKRDRPDEAKAGQAPARKEMKAHSTLNCALEEGQLSQRRQPINFANNRHAVVVKEGRVILHREGAPLQ